MRKSLSLLGLGILVLFLVELVMPLSLVKASGGAIPICSVGCCNKSCNLQGYAFSFCGTNCPYVKQVDMCLRIPSSLPSLLKNVIIILMFMVSGLHFHLIKHALKQVNGLFKLL